MALKTQDTALAPSCQPTSCGTELGDLTRQLDVLRDEANTLFVMYENDEAAYAMSSYARQIRDRADRIASTLNSMGDALQILEI